MALTLRIPGQSADAHADRVLDVVRGGFHEQMNDVVTRFTEYYGLVLGLVILAFALGLRRGVLDFLRLAWPGRAR